MDFSIPILVLALIWFLLTSKTRINQLLALWLTYATILDEFASFSYADSCRQFVVSL